MLLRKLALSVGRLDFWNLENELTPYELAVHFAAMQVEPIGEDRADQRSATQTLALIQSQRTKPMQSDEIEKLADYLLRYIPAYADKPDENITPDESAKLAKAAFARVGL